MLLALKASQQSERERLIKVNEDKKKALRDKERELKKMQLMATEKA